MGYLACVQKNTTITTSPFKTFRNSVTTSTEFVVQNNE